VDSKINSETIVAHYSSKQSTITIGHGIFNFLVRLLPYSKWDVIGAIISDRVYLLHRQTIDDSLQEINACIKGYDDTEYNKSYAYAESYFNYLLHNQFSRKSLLIGIGGGVTTDFTGYLASSYMRGIDIVYVPTTLLAMVDASIGGKVAVNIEAGKNIIGHFHQPDYIIVDTGFLTTLPVEEWKCGMSEAVKHAIIGDSSSLNLFLRREVSIGNVNESLYHCVKNSVHFKANIVEQDEFEKNIRSILNYGHTVGHAIESVFHYTLSHGEAVAVGMLVESYISMKMGMPQEDFEMIKELLLYYKLLPDISFSTSDIIDHMQYDKKNIKGTILFVLLEKVGKPVIGQEVPGTLITEALNYYLTMV